MKRLALLTTSLLISLSVLNAQANGHGDHSHKGHSQGAHDSEVKHKMKGKHKAHMAARMKKADTDGDGKISRQEFLENAEQRFKRMDSDGDGFITRGEGKAAHKKMRQEHKNMYKKLNKDSEQ